MIDRKWIGKDWGESVLHVERDRLRAFAHAIGETDPVYLDPLAARRAGYTDMLAPPTFVFAAEMDSGVLDRLLADLDMPPERLLHGEQSFRFHQPVCAGDTVTVRSTITDIFDKKAGALSFVVRESKATNQHGAVVCELKMVLVRLNGGRA